MVEQLACEKKKKSYLILLQNCTDTISLLFAKPRIFPRKKKKKLKDPTALEAGYALRKKTKLRTEAF